MIFKSLYVKTPRIVSLFLRLCIHKSKQLWNLKLKEKIISGLSFLLLVLF